jgi:hypothetical protein
MGPKFEATLYFEEDGALEVCGPTNFGPDDISLELLKVTVVDKNGDERHTHDLHLLFTKDEMWEADIEEARRHLAPGNAKGVGKGRVTKRNGQTRNIEWASRFEIVDTQSFLTTSP